jgi:hypothetical protein
MEDQIDHAGWVPHAPNLIPIERQLLRLDGPVLG